MRGLTGFDTGSNGHEDGNDYAFNLYICDSCGNICKENVWHNKGLTWIEYNQPSTEPRIES